MSNLSSIADSDQPLSEARDTLTLQRHRDETECQTIARYQMRGGVSPARTIQAWLSSQLMPLSIMPLMEELSRQAQLVNAGDLSGGKQMLAEQAVTLDQLFHTLMRRALSSGDLVAMERYLRLGLKAQSQSRCTWETIGELVNPRSVAFIKAGQANVGQAVQVNNAREDPSLQNEQLGDGHVRADSRASTPAIGSDPAVAALGAIDGATIGRGQGGIGDECVPGRRASPAAPARKTPAEA